MIPASPRKYSRVFSSTLIFVILFFNLSCVTISRTIEAATSTPVIEVPMATTTQNAQTTHLGQKGTIEDIVYSPDGGVLAVASPTGIYLYDANTLKEKRFIDTGEQIFCVVYLKDGSLRAMGKKNPVNSTGINIWNITNEQQEFYALEQASEGLLNMFSPDGQLLARNRLYSAVIWDVATGKSVFELMSDYSEVIDLGMISGMDFDGQQLAMVSIDGKVKIWSVPNIEAVTIRVGNMDGGGTNIALLPDGQSMATSFNGLIKIWDVSSGKEIATFAKYEGNAVKLEISSDGKLLAIGMSDGTIKIWGMDTKQEITTLTGHEKLIKKIAFSPNGNFLISVSDDNVIKTWNIISGQEIATQTDHVQ